MSRAGVAEAARFLTLEFPYRIGYFNENGRLANPPKVDCEERYYHKGLYLHSSRFEVGDLLSGDGATTNAYDGGHIAILIGIKDGYYYVAETLWGTPRTAEGLVAMKYTPEELEYYFYWWIPMDEYYGEDGNLTDFWN